MKVFVHPPGERWIVDRQVNEFVADNADICTAHPRDADVIWLYAGWCWDQLVLAYTPGKRVILTEHHIVPDKLDVAEWRRRDQIVNEYHVPNRYTAAQVRELTDKPIHVIPYWAHPDSVKKVDKLEARKALGLPLDAFIFGSFQRDGEGHDPMVPKLEKGPDLLCTELERTKQHRTNMMVLLGGWRRDYVKVRLTKSGIPFVHLENDPRLSEMYSALDVYVSLSRFEGGPMSLIECGLTDTHVLAARRVGIVDELGLFGAPDWMCGTPDVSKLLTTNGGYEPFRRMLTR